MDPLKLKLGQKEERKENQRLTSKESVNLKAFREKVKKSVFSEFE